MAITCVNNTLKIEGDLASAISAYLTEMGGEVQARTIRNSRTDTGQTKGSYEYQLEEGTCESTVYVGSSLENAIWEEYGTGEYALGQDGRKGGWVYRSEKTGNFYHTMGKKPNQPLFKAFTSLSSRFKSRLETVLKEKLG